MTKITPHNKYNLREIINARGTFTPLGVSRTPEPVIEATGEALRHYFDMDALQQAAGRILAGWSGCEWGTVTNCSSASLTLAAAATMTGTDMDLIRQLPRTDGLNNIVVMPAGHRVDYGQKIEQAIRLSGCEVQIAGSNEACTGRDIEQALSGGGITALLLVDSRMCPDRSVDIAEAVKIAHAKDISVILDGAAQDLRVSELVSTNADLIVMSAQKYLSAPTAGIVIGRRDLVDALLLQGRGIGRGMKAGKEAIIGALAAVEYRQSLDMKTWEMTKREEAEDFAARLNNLPSITAWLVRDPTNSPFWRVHAKIDPEISTLSANQIAKELAKGDPAIYVFDAEAGAGILNFELISLRKSERDLIIERLAAIMA